MHQTRVFLFLFSALSMTCPRFSCRNLPPNVCARKQSPSEIALSTDMCPLDRFCPAERIFEDWWWYGFLEVGAAFPCLPLDSYEHVDVSDGDVYKEWPCEQWEEGKDLAVGNHPKDCGNEDDCRLLDGSVRPCFCGLRSTVTSGICSPHLSSAVFQPYWQGCSQTHTTNKDLGFYYTVLQKLYIVAQTPPDLDCAARVIWELKLLSALEYRLNSAAWAVAVSLLLVV